MRSILSSSTMRPAVVFEDRQVLSPPFSEAKAIFEVLAPDEQRKVLPEAQTTVIRCDQHVLLPCCLSVHLRAGARMEKGMANRSAEWIIRTRHRWQAPTSL